MAGPGGEGPRRLLTVDAAQKRYGLSTAQLMCAGIERQLVLHTVLGEFCLDETELVALLDQLDLAGAA